MSDAQAGVEPPLRAGIDFLAGLIEGIGITERLRIEIIQAQSAAHDDPFEVDLVLQIKSHLERRIGIVILERLGIVVQGVGEEEDVIETHIKAAPQLVNLVDLTGQVALDAVGVGAAPFIDPRIPFAPEHAGNPVGIEHIGERRGIFIISNIRIGAALVIVIFPPLVII